MMRYNYCAFRYLTDLLSVNGRLWTSLTYLRMLTYETGNTHT